MSTLRVDVGTKKRLVRVKGELEAKDGKMRTFQDVINELIDCFEVAQ